jgi:hypothetical protein
VLETIIGHIRLPVSVSAVAFDEVGQAHISPGWGLAFEAPMLGTRGWSAGEDEGREEESAEDGLVELHGRR